MSAPEVCDKFVDAIKSGKYDVIITNFANPDMVGHTGVEPACIKAIETVDKCVGRVVDALLEVGGQMFITADHGNADKELADDGVSPFTAHTTNRVPFILASGDTTLGLQDTGEGRLADVAPTLVDILGLEKPSEWTGNSLLTRK